MNKNVLTSVVFIAIVLETVIGIVVGNCLNLASGIALGFGFLLVNTSALIIFTDS